MSTRPLAVCTLVALTWLSACAADKPAETPADPAAALKANARPGPNQPLNIDEQRSLVERVWNENKGSPEARREAVKQVVWQASSGTPARVRGLELLADDATDANRTDTRAMLSLLLPVEPDYGLTRRACELITANNWQDLTPALVRALARQQSVIPDEERAEAVALKAINPGQSLEQIAFALFAREPRGTGRLLERQERERSAAWDLLTRLDRDGTKRAAIVSAPEFATQGAAGELQDAARALGCVPITGEQLAWLRQMKTDGAATNWWSGASLAIASIPAESRNGWALRHAEAARWARQHKPEWLSASRADLTAEIKTRLRPRKTHSRAPEGADELGGNESFIDHENKLVWGDLLLILVADEALRSGGVARSLWQQAERDRLDQSTELGGIVNATGAAWEFKLFPPRGTQRLSDKRFIASDEMIKASPFSIAHYHFHAQDVNNARYAGPSPGDTEYAARFGRACLIFTPIKQGVLGVDILLPTGLCVDLGELNAC